MNFVLLLRNQRKCEIHEPVVPDVSHEIETSANSYPIRRRRNDDSLRVISRGRVKEIENGFPDFTSTISIGDHISIGRAVFENTPLQDLRLGLCTASDQQPVGTSCKESPHSICRAPIEIVIGGVAISESRRNRNNALMLVVREGHENVDATRRGILRPCEQSNRRQPQSSR